MHNKQASTLNNKPQKGKQRSESKDAMIYYLKCPVISKKKIKTCKEIVNCDPSTGKSRKQNMLARILDVGLSRQ